MFSRTTLEHHSTDMRQFIDFRASTLPSGMRIIEVYNSSGLSFTLLPDRAMDIWTAFYNGLPLTWISQGSPHLPDFGAPWLRQYNGGLLTTCGLSNAGDAETDTITGEHRGLHGDFTRLRAYQIEGESGWQGDQYRVKLTCYVAQTSLFGEQLRVKRTYSITLGEPVIDITDVVENRFDVPVPMMMLYHFNLGYPLVSEGAQLVLPGEHVYPCDAEARNGLAHWMEYSAATRGVNEQVFYHHLKHNGNNKTSVAIFNPEFGLQLEWDTTYAPYFTQWKNVRRNIYVSGIEPGNCIPEGLNAARANDRLVMLQPDETHTFHNQLRVLPNAAYIEQSCEQIRTLQTQGHLLTNGQFKGL